MKPPRISFIGLITLLFIVLKLTNYIDWSWWFVFSPIWGSVLLLFILSTVIYFIEKFD